MWRKLVLLTLSGGLSLLGAELALRYVLGASPFEASRYVPKHLTERDETLRWRFSAAEGRNRLGLRNREMEPKPEGTVRILFLGDSLIWSGDTSSGELHTEVLERRLNSGPLSGGTEFEVVNAGIPGYTTYQELEFLKIYGLEMEPDLVVLGFVFNDLYYRYLNRTTDRKRLDIEPDARRHRFNPRAFPGRLLGWSYLAHEIFGVAEATGKRLLGRPVFPFERRADFYLAWKDHGWRHAGELIGKMQQLLTERRIKLLLLVFPLRDQVDERLRELDPEYVLGPQRRIAEICREFAIPVLDLTEPIRVHGGVSLYRDYLHLNEGGNDVVVDEVGPFLEKEIVRSDGTPQHRQSPSGTLGPP